MVQWFLWEIHNCTNNFNTKQYLIQISPIIQVIWHWDNEKDKKMNNSFSFKMMFKMGFWKIRGKGVEFVYFTWNLRIWRWSDSLNVGNIFHWEMKFQLRNRYLVWKAVRCHWRFLRIVWSDPIQHLENI